MRVQVVDGTLIVAGVALVCRLSWTSCLGDIGSLSESFQLRASRPSTSRIRCLFHPSSPAECIKVVRLKDTSIPVHASEPYSAYVEAHQDLPRTCRVAKDTPLQYSMPVSA